MDSMEVAETVASATTEQEAQCVIPVVSGTVTHDTACIGHTTSEPMELGKTCTVEPVWPIKVTNATEELHPAATVSVIVAAQEVGLDSVVPMTSIRSGAPMTSCIAGATLESCTATVTKTMHPSHDVTSMQSATDSTHLKLLFPLAEAAQAQTVNVPTGTATPVPKQPREENHSTIDTLFPITIGTSTLTHLAPGTAEPLSLHPPVSLTHIGPTALGTLHNLEESALTTSSASLSSCETDLTYIFPFLQGIQCDAHTPIAAAQAVPVTSSTLQCFAPFVPLLSPISEISDIHETGTCTTLAGSPMWTERTDGSDTGYMVGNAEEEELRRRVLEGLDGIQWVRSEKRVERLSKLQSGVERQEDADMDVIEWYREKANDEDGILRLSPVREDDARSFHVSIAVPPSRPHGDGSENLMVSIPSSSETTETSAAGEASASRSPEEPSSSDRKRPRPSFSSARSDMAVVDGHFSAPSQNRHAHTLVASSAEDHHHHSVPVQSTTTTTTTQLNPLPEDAVHFQDDSAHPIPPTFTSLTALGPVRRPWLARSVTRDTVASSCFTSDMSATGDASAVDSGVGDLSVVNDDGVMVMGKGKDLLPYDVQGSLTTFLAMDKGVRAVEVYRVECLTPGSVGVAKTIYGGDKAMENNLGGMYEPIKEEQYDKGGRVRKTSGTGGDTPSVDPPLGMTVEEVETPFEGEDRERVSIAGMTGIVLAQLAYLLLVLSATGHRGVIGTVIGMGSACLWTWVGSWNRRTRDKLLMGCLMWMMAWCAAGAGVGSGEVGDAMMGVAGVGGAGGWVLGAAMMSHGGKRGGKWTRRMMNVLGGWVLVFAPVLGGVVAVAPDRERWIGAGVTCAMVLSALLWALEMWKKPRTRSQAQPQSPSEQVPATHHGDIPKLGFWPVLLLSFGSAAFIGGLSFGGLPASPFTYLPCFSNTNTIPIPLSWTIIRTLLTVGSTFLLLGLALYIHTHSVSTVLPKLLIPISTSLTISSITLLLHFPTLTIPSLSCASWDWTLLIPLLGVLLSPLFDMHHTRYATKTMMTISRLVVLVAGATVLLVSSPTAISTTTGSEVGPLIGLFCVAICVRVATGPKRDAGTGGVTVVSGILLGTAMARCVVGMYTYLHRNNNNNKSDGEMLVIIPQALRVLHGVGLGLAGLAACVYLLSHFTDRIRKQHPLPDRNLSSIA
ncbi:hypothetical protein BC832DRAFT_552645 [Gaertneriomyces semiglobifer]|nr:hypothetical protein BC832DRAFT_552645 [Gaertneriomyces semiglobifer]